MKWGSCISLFCHANPRAEGNIEPPTKPDYGKTSTVLISIKS